MRGSSMNPLPGRSVSRNASMASAVAPAATVMYSAVVKSSASEAFVR